MFMPITITFHIFRYTITLTVKSRTRHSAKWRVLIIELAQELAEPFTGIAFSVYNYSKTKVNCQACILHYLLPPLLPPALCRLPLAGFGACAVTSTIPRVAKSRPLSPWRWKRIVIWAAKKEEFENSSHFLSLPRLGKVAKPKVLTDEVIPASSQNEPSSSLGG